jgi:hypothetical protein
MRNFVLQKAVEAATNRTDLCMLTGSTALTPTEAAVAVVDAYKAALKALNAGVDQSSPPVAQAPL